MAIFLVVAQRGSWRRCGPTGCSSQGIGKSVPRDDLAGPDLGPPSGRKRFRRETPARRNANWFRLLRGLLLQHDARIAVLRRHEAAMVRTRRVGPPNSHHHGAARDLQIRESIQRAFENQVLQGQGGVPAGCRRRWTASHCRQKRLGQFRRAGRVDEQDGAQFLCFGPDRIILCRGEAIAQHARPDRGAAQPGPSSPPPIAAQPGLDIAASPRQRRPADQDWPQ